MRRILAAGMLFSLAAWTGCARTKDVVKIDSGRVQGSTRAGVTSFKGIPYAKPPVGKLRWEPPQPVAQWKGVREATHYGHDCMQLPFPSDAAPLGTKPSEDCLMLNVWTPAHHKGKLPVMVWIYGGGFVNGGSSPILYSGRHFASKGIVFVSFNYRLGRFGFFAFPALTKEAKGGLVGNYGFMDQISALKWVKRNIAAFGGNPDDVTVFGESAGGMSVHVLMTSPLARGLFEKAMVESGGGRTMMNATGVTEGMEGKPSGEQIGVNFARSMGIQRDGAAALAKLRALPAKEIVDGMNMASMRAAASTYAGPMIDGRIVMGQPETLYRQGKYERVPLLLGTNSMDLGFSFAKTRKQLFAPFGKNPRKAEKAYGAKPNSDLRILGRKVAADAMMIEPARFVARALSAQGDMVWEYRFGYVADSMRKQWPGAPHATEIPFVFDTVKAKYGAKATAADEKAGEEANSYWANFVKTGNPNGEGLPHWPAYTVKKDELMMFTEDHGPVAMPDPWKERLDLTEAVANAKMKAQK